MLKAFVICLLFALVFADQDRDCNIAIANLELRVLALEAETEINNVQGEYNRNFDALIAFSGFESKTGPVYTQTLANLMKTFCPPNVFVSWSAPPSLFFNTIPEVANLYGNLLAGTVFQNVSRHIITQPIIQFYIQNNNNYALFNSSIVQISKMINNVGQYVVTTNIGHYEHTYIFYERNWCIKQFISRTTGFINQPADTVTVASTDPTFY